MISQNIDPISRDIYDKVERFLSNYKTSTFPSKTELQKKVDAFLKLEGNTLLNKVGIIISLSNWEKGINENFYERSVIPFEMWKKKFVLTLGNSSKIIWITQWEYDGSYHSNELASYDFPL
jgi:hypothetical protein